MERPATATLLATEKAADATGTSVLSRICFAANLVIVELVSKMVAVTKIRDDHRNHNEHSMEDSKTKLNLKF